MGIKTIRLRVLQVFVFCGSLSGFAQTEVNNDLITDEPIKPLKFVLNESGSQSIQFGLWTQVWLRAIENNPGTLVNGQEQETTYDAGFRRLRLTVSYQFADRYKVFLQVGANNQSFISGGGVGTGGDGMGKKAKVFFHDIYNEFLIVKKDESSSLPFSLNLGVGLHAWNGVSRLSNASTNKMLTADIPVYNYPNIDRSDQLGRQFGVFVHGDIGKLGYRMHVNKPFATNMIPTSANESVDNNGKGNLAYGGYYYYQFFDLDSQETAFLAGSYLGTKKVFNIGAGFYTSKNATATLKTDNTLNFHSASALGADVFLDMPVGNPAKHMAISLYSAYYNYNYGKNYIRTLGVMNPGVENPDFTGQVAAEGFGNSKFLMGTGSIWHTTAAFILPKKDRNFQIQPYVTYALKDLEALNQKGSFYDFGANLLLKEHNAKISLQYGSRPLYDNSTKKVFDRASEILASVQFYL